MTIVRMVDKFWELIGLIESENWHANWNYPKTEFIYKILVNIKKTIKQKINPRSFSFNIKFDLKCHEKIPQPLTVHITGYPSYNFYDLHFLNFWFKL